MKDFKEEYPWAMEDLTNLTKEIAEAVIETKHVRDKNEFVDKIAAFADTHLYSSECVITLLEWIGLPSTPFLRNVSPTVEWHDIAAQCKLDSVFDDIYDQITSDIWDKVNV